MSKLVRHKINITNKDITWNPIVDSGAERSVISSKLARQTGIPITTKFNFSVVGFDGVASDKVLGFIQGLEVTVPSTAQKHKISPIVIDDPSANLLGIDLIDQAGGGEFIPGPNGNLTWQFNQARDAKIKTPWAR